MPVHRTATVLRPAVPAVSILQHLLGQAQSGLAERAGRGGHSLRRWLDAWSRTLPGARGGRSQSRQAGP